MAYAAASAVDASVVDGFRGRADGAGPVLRADVAPSAPRAVAASVAYRDASAELAFARVVACGAGLLLWYKRVMIALADDAAATGWFLAACAIGFVAAAALALVRSRAADAAAPERAAVLQAAASPKPLAVPTVPLIAASALLTALAAMLPAAAPVAIPLAIVPAAVAFLHQFANGLATLPANRRATAFAAIFFVSGALNTATDLAELPMLRVAGLAPNLLFAALAAAVSAVADLAIPADADESVPEVVPANEAPSPFGAPVAPVPSSPEAISTSFEITRTSSTCLLAATSIGLLYLAMALKDTVAYPTAVEAVSPSGFVRFIELPLWVLAGFVADRIGRRQAIEFSMTLALLGGAGLLAVPGTLVASVCTLCSYASLITFPAVAMAIVVDDQAESPLLPAVAALCFLPVPLGAAAGAATTALGWTNEARYLALVAVLVAFAATVLRLARSLPGSSDALAPAAAPESAPDAPDAPASAAPDAPASANVSADVLAEAESAPATPEATAAIPAPADAPAAVTPPEIAPAEAPASPAAPAPDALAAWVAATAAEANLTAREAEVLALVAEGRTAQQIADELVVTRSTAKYHITNILKKTGAPTRAILIDRLTVHLAQSE